MNTLISARKVREHTVEDPDLSGSARDDARPQRNERIMKPRILCVDDEPMFLAMYEQQLSQFDVSVASRGELGLRAIQEHGPFAVIVSDLRMPSMNGTQFLAEVRQAAPDSIRMLLTSETDIHAAIDAVNEGHIFRFLTKPCPPDTLIKSVQAAIVQHRLITTEKDLLEQTLRGSIEVLTEVLSLVSPQAFGKASRIRRLIQKLGGILQIPNPWLLDVAAMLSQIGCVSIPDPILSKLYAGGALPQEDRAIFERHPKIGRDLIRKIPRLEEASEIILHQNRRFDELNWPADDGCGGPVSLGAQILKVALDYEELESQGLSRSTAIERLSVRKGWYDPRVLQALLQMPDDEAQLTSHVIPIRELRPRMIMAEDLLNNSGVLLIRKGQETSGAMLYRLLNHSLKGTVPETVRILIPANSRAT